MDLRDWTEEGIDRTRLGRLGVGYVLGAAGIIGALGFFAATAKGNQASEEDVIEVALATLPEEPEPEEPEPEEPEPEPVAAPAPVTPAARAPRPGPKLPQLDTPDAIPDDAPAEEDPSDSPDSGADPYEDGIGDGTGVGTGNQTAPAPGPAPAPKPKPKPKPKKKPKKKKPIRVTEDVTPPAPISQSMPAYPSAAKAAGVEGTVIVTYVVTESGSVTGVRAVRGPAELRGVCEAAVRRWKFKPAMLDGRPVSVRRVARFPFRIKT